MLTTSASYTDLYELSMAQLYFEQGREDEPAVFDYFFRKLPFGGGYALFAGLDSLLASLEDWQFSQDDLAYLGSQGFSARFLEYLAGFRFRGGIRSAAEGDLIFPLRPVLQVTGGLVETQLIETMLLNILNFQSLIATKASRIRAVAGDRRLIEFGLRRAQGLGSYHASRAAIIGGFDATSNVLAGRDFGIPVSGTMAHSFVQGYQDELAAFRAFARRYPDAAVLLVDTYDSLGSGLPKAITVAEELRRDGHELLAIRLDSGDLAYLAGECRRRLDAAGFPGVRIAVSNQLDEYLIRSLLGQGAPIDIFGVGTALVTGYPDAALDGVYKLASSNGQPRMKLSDNLSKTSLPSEKQVYRYSDPEGRWLGADAVSLADEAAPQRIFHPTDSRITSCVPAAAAEPILRPVFAAGRRLQPPLALGDIAAYARERLERLPPEYRRFENPHSYRVGLSPALLAQRDRLLATHRGEDR